MRRPVIAVCGDGAVPDGDRRLAVAEALGTALVDAGYRVLCGGRGGVMAAVARGAKSSAKADGSDVIGILPGSHPDDANAWIDIALPTGLGHLRNGVVAHADAVIGIGGRSGTLSELAMGWTLGRPVLAWRGAGWSARLADAPIDDRRDSTVHGFDTVEQAIEALRPYFA